MIDIDPQLIRLSALTKSFKQAIENSGKTMVEIGKNMGITQPSISAAISGNKKTSDGLFVRIGKATGLSDEQIKEIFEKADRQFFEAKYGRDILSEKEYSYDELFKMMKEKEDLSNEQIKAIQEYIELQKLKK